MARERVISYGYIIADICGIVKFETLRRSRKDCWSAFLSDKEAHITKARLQGMGFRAVPVWIKESADAAKSNGR